MSWLPSPSALQHISFPLELMGMSLAALQILHPRAETVAEEVLDRVSEQDLFGDLKGLQWKRGKRMLWSVLFVLLTGLAYLSTKSFGHFALLLAWEPFHVGAFYIACGAIGGVLCYMEDSFMRVLGAIALIGALPLLLIVVWLVQAIILFVVLVPRGLNLVNKGNALGALGLLLGGSGLLLESVQVIMQDVEEQVAFAQLYWVGITVFLGVLLVLLSRILDRARNKEQPPPAP